MSSVPVIQVSTPVAAGPSTPAASSASQAQAGGSSVSARNDSGSGTTFAGALKDAVGKSSKKSGSSKTSEETKSGTALPAGGNAVPPTSSVPTAMIAGLVPPPTAVAATTIEGDTMDEGVTALSSGAKGDGAKVVASSSTTGLTEKAPAASTEDSAAEPIGTFGARLASGQSAADVAAEAATAAASPTAAIAACTTAAGGAAARAATATSAAATKASVKSSAADSRPVAKITGNERQGTVSAGNDTTKEEPAGSVSAAAQQASVQATAASDVDAVDAPAVNSGAVTVKPKSARSMDASDAGSGGDAEPEAGTVAVGNSSVATGDAAASATDAAAAGHAAANVSSAQAATVLLAQATIEKHAHADSLAGTSSLGADATAGAAQMSAGATGSAASDVTPTATLQVHANVESAGFAQGLSDKVSWMVGNGVNSAKLQVNPPQLGPIELSISVTGDHAQVSMVTHSAVTRDALESSSSALKDLLGSQGFGQVSVDISQRSFQERSAYTPPSYEQSSSSRASAAATAAVASTAATSARVSTSVLDAYA